MLNPYESPQTVDDATEKAWWLPADIGQLVGTYLQTLALLSLVSMLAQLVLSDQMYIDFSFVFLNWAGMYLKRHSPTARKWVIRISGLFVTVAVGMVLIAACFGTHAMTVNFAGNRVQNPTIVHVLGVVSVGVLLAGFPFVLLLTRQARSEFSPKTYASPQSDSTTTLSSPKRPPTAWMWAAFAWGEFIGGLVVLGSWDYYVRWRDGWLGNGGSPTPDEIWFGVPLVLGGVAVLLLWRSTANISRLWIRAAVVVAQSLIGFAAYLAACLWYVLETGVDSL